MKQSHSKTQPPSPSPSPDQRRLTGSRAAFLYGFIALLAGIILLSLGAGGPISDRVLAVAFVLANSAWIPLVYLIGALGLGRVARRWTHTIPNRWVVELGIGLTLSLSLSHGLGVLGWLNPISAWIVTGIGCVLLISDLRIYLSNLNTQQGNTRMTIPGVVFVLGCVIVLIASCNPPGALWDSEFGSYDALSYHLQLPREWVELGRIMPVEHNIYSYLPSYIESAYVHFAYLADAPSTTKTTNPSGLSGFLAQDGRVAMSTQLFSAFLMITSAIALRSVLRRAMNLYLPTAHQDDSGKNNENPNYNQEDRYPALFARALMMCTPWLFVVGSIAYNEIAVVLLSICACSIVIERNLSATLRSGIAALIVAGACSCKPTALFLVAPSVGVLLLSTIPPKRWLLPIGLGMLVGVLALSPWFIRNSMSTGNIVFPQAASIFGDGHWSASQLELYRSAHHFDGSLLDRFMMLILPDANGTHHISTFRGLTNLQWGITPLLGLIGCIVLISRKRFHKMGAVLTLALMIPLIAWAMLTHLQSRFLVPIAPIMIGIAGFAAASFTAGEPNQTSNNIIQLRNRLIQLSLCIAALVSVWMLSIQSAGHPFILVDLGTSVYTGQATEITDPPWTAALNNTLAPDETVYLLGDSNPFYVRSPMIYNTVYDRWLIQDAIEESPADPAQWTRYLIEQNIDIVVISFSEISRFAHSGWLPASIDPDQLIEWIDSLDEPIYVWTLPGQREPIRAAFRIVDESQRETRTNQ